MVIDGRGERAPVVDVVPVVDTGLGNSAYLVDLGDGGALAVDVSRDLRAVRRESAARGLTIRFVADTHLHADFLTGALDLADHGAQVVASAGGDRRYPHLALRDGDDLDLGGLTLRALSTPGHTHEHVAYALLDGGRTLGVFTGGSLLVGSAARTDLVSPDRTEELARAQYRSLRRLAILDDDVAVWPTHGAGSFCSAPPGAERTSTIGTERATNALLGAATEDAFVAALLGGLGTYPPYFDRLPELNRRGPAPGHPASLPPLGVEQVATLQADDAWVVDVRPVDRFAEGHLPGAVSIPLRDAFATWLGWLVPADRPLVVVRDTDQDPDEIRWQAHKIGHDWVVGELAGGVPAWVASGRPAPTLPLVLPQDAAGATVVDVRQAAEFAAGHVPGALHHELGALPDAADALPAGPLLVVCGHGERAMTGASLLARAGRHQVSVLDGGPGDVARATGRRLVGGP
ncbi:rhodanese-like domain-containing protein [Thalassiella azotivora]